MTWWLPLALLAALAVGVAVGRWSVPPAAPQDWDDRPAEQRWLSGVLQEAARRMDAEDARAASAARHLGPGAPPAAWGWWRPGGRGEG